MTGLRQRVVTGLRWQAAAKLGSQLVSWAITIVVMRLLAPADYGLMAMTMVVVGLTALVAELGLGAALVRAPEAPRAFQRQVFGVALVTNTGLYVLLMVMAPLSALAFDEPRLWALTAVAGLQLPLSALSVVPESMARREMGFKALSLIELGTQIGGAVVTLTAAWAEWGAWSLVAGHVAAAVIKASLLLSRFGTVMPDFRIAGQRALLTFGGSLTLNRVLWYFSTQADVFIAGRLLGPQLLGLYSVAANLASLPMQKLMGVANQVAYSAFSKLQHDRPALLDGLAGSLRALLAVTTGLLWGMAGAAPDLVPWLLGTKWTAAVPLLQLIALVVPLRIATSVFSTALIAVGEVGTDLRNTLTSAAVMIPAFLVGALHGGVLGLALAWAIGYPLLSTILFVRARRILGFGFRRLLHTAAPSAVAGTAMVATMMTLGAAVPLPSASARLMLQCLAGGGVYVIVVALLDRTLLPHARSLLMPSRDGR